MIPLVLGTTACAYMAFSPTPPASRKSLAHAVVTPNPPRPFPERDAAVDYARPGDVTAAQLDDPFAPPDGATSALPGSRSERGLVASPRVHTVQGGETLYAISRRYGVDVFALAEANALAAPYAIYAGQALTVPTSRSGPGQPYPGDLDGGPMVASLPAEAGPLPSPPQRSGRGFIWPIDGKVLSTFGPKARGLRNDGINIAARRGAAVHAIDNGVVAYAGNELRGFGNMVLIKHDGGWVSAYAHNDSLLVTRGERVSRGQTIARAGSTGRTDSPQLHFQLRKGLTPVDPLAYLPAPRT